MANQPKKYKKFVATAATATLVASAIVPVASAAGFTDVAGNSHEEAINALAEAGIINGYADGTFKPNQEVNRGQVVKLLGRWLETEGFEAPADWETEQYFNDLPLTAEKELVKYAALAKDAGVFAGSNGNLNFTQNMQRQQMAVVLVRAINEIYDLDLVKEYKDADFKSEISDLDKAFSAEQREAITALEYAELTNAATLSGKAFNPANSITRGQFASFLYRTINLDLEEATEVVPTAIEVTSEKSVQAEFGEKVTVTAKVTVPSGESAANIPVTFAVDPSKDTLLVPQMKKEVETDENGIATFTYTRDHSYSSDEDLSDDVTVYPTAKPTLKAVTKVYWGQSLKIADITKETVLANDEQKVYQIQGEEGEEYYVAYQENLNVAPEKAVRDVEFLGLPTTGDTATAQYPYEYTTGGFVAGVIKLDSTGKANLVLTGKDASATPIVYKPNTKTGKYSENALQAKGSTVKFEKESVYDLSIAAEGKQIAAYNKGTNGEIGGRDYVITLKTKDGKPVANADVKVGFNKETSSNLKDIKVYDKDAKAVETTGDSAVFELSTDSEGKVKFTVTQTVTDAYATPIAFLDTGDTLGKLDDKDIQVAGEIVYFREVKPADYTSELVLTNDEGKKVTTFGADKTATFTYQLSDQNGKPRSYTSDTTVQFTVRAGATAVTVENDGKVETIEAYSSRSFSSKILTGTTKTEIKVKGNSSKVRVTATPTNSGLSGLTSVVKEAEFLSGASTSYFVVGKGEVGTTMDSVTLTFTEAVSLNEVNIQAAGTTATSGTTVSADSSNNKLLYVYFTPGLTQNTEGFKISYKGKTYEFLYNPETATFNLQ